MQPDTDASLYTQAVASRLLHSPCAAQNGLVVFEECPLIDESPSPEEVLECLTRSGYIMESRLVSLLTQEGFFVEANSVMKDPRTGKSREIDLIAEDYRYTPEHKYSCVKTTFVIEAINNRYPFVLMTPWSLTPLSPTEYRTKFAFTPSSDPITGHLDLDDEKRLLESDVYSQFCVLSRKGNSGPLMASHSDDVYGSLLKSAEYIEQRIDEWDHRKLEDEYWRVFFWQPVLVLSGKLLIAELGQTGEVSLRDVPAARLAFNWHSDERPATTIFSVVTEPVMLDLVRRVVADDFRLESKVHAIRVERMRAPPANSSGPRGD